MKIIDLYEDTPVFNKALKRAKRGQALKSDSVKVLKQYVFDTLKGEISGIMDYIHPRQMLGLKIENGGEFQCYISFSDYVHHADIENIDAELENNLGWNAYPDDKDDERLIKITGKLE